MKKLALVPLIPAAACLAFAAPALASTSETSQPEAVSENWAGYEVTPTGSTDFASVSGGWTVKQVTGSDASESDGSYSDYGFGDDTGMSSESGDYSAFWVGLGGGDANSDALEQIGTEANVNASGQTKYYAWYELVPSAPVKIDVAVKPGDKVWAKTTVDGDEVSFTIDNDTTGQSWSKTIKMTAATPDTSTAEWVAEAPSSCQGGSATDCAPLSLANFGKVNFTDASVTSDAGTTGSISDSAWSHQAIDLADEASPSKLSDNGAAFSVSYGADTADDSASGDGYGYGSSGDYGYGSSGDYGYGTTGGYGASDGYGYGATGGYGASDGYGTTGGYGASDGYGTTGDYGYGDGAYGLTGGTGYGATGSDGYGDDSYGTYGYSAAIADAVGSLLSSGTSTGSYGTSYSYVF